VRHCRCPMAGSGILEDPTGRSKEDIEQALQTLKNSAERDSCLSACELIEAVTFRSTTCQQRLLEISGIEILLESMKKHLQDRELQIMFCRILQHLAASAPKELSKAGACSVLKAVLEAHPSEASVHQASWQALELIALRDEEARRVAVQDGCPELVVASLKKFRGPGDAAVQEACLAALQALLESATSELCQSVAKTGGIAAIIGALADHRDHAQMQYWGQIVLAHLCCDNPELRTEAQRKCHWQKIEIDFDL